MDASQSNMHAIGPDSREKEPLSEMSDVTYEGIHSKQTAEGQVIAIFSCSKLYSSNGNIEKVREQNKPGELPSETSRNDKEYTRKRSAITRKCHGSSRS
jgi:hypothetical protein